jgi:hypothetical protein
MLHPNCVICGEAWSSIPEDKTTMWCSPEDCSHDTLWAFVSQDGSVSFDLEMWGIGEPSYHIRWNCDCMVEECFGKNVVIDVDDPEGEYKIIKSFDPPLPYTITRQELIRLLEE